MTDDALKEPAEDWDGKTFGQAAAEDQDKADAIAAEKGDGAEAEARFEQESSESDIGQTPHS